MNLDILQLPGLYPRQQEIADADYRFKVWRAGRRTGKTRSALTNAVVGHGPMIDGVHKFPGILDGYDVPWLAPDYPQAKAIWEEEIKPRFTGRPGVRINNGPPPFVEIEGKGRLYLATAENINAIRGRGARIAGVIIDEGAHLDLENAWRAVIRPILMDRKGWAIIQSTPKVDSWFNQLCEEIEDGKRSDHWYTWHDTARVNPFIDPVEFEELVSEYPIDSDDMAQEVEALLLKIGGGLLFRELRSEVHHVSQVVDTTTDHRAEVCADWGWTAPAPALWVATNKGLDGPARHHVYREWWPTETVPPEWARQVIDKSRLETSGGGELLEISRVVLDSAAWATGQDGSPSVAEQMLPVLREHGVSLVPSQKGPNSLRNSTMLLHTYFEHAAGTILPYLTVSPECPVIWRELTTIRRGNPEERASEDPDVRAPHQGGHGHDALRYWAMGRPRPKPLVLADRLAADEAYQLLQESDTSLSAMYEQRARRAGVTLAKVRDLDPPKQRKYPWER